MPDPTRSPAPAIPGGYDVGIVMPFGGPRFDAPAFVAGLTAADIPDGLQLAPGVSVTDPAVYLADLQGALADEGARFFLGVERAAELRDALAAIPS